MSNRVTQKKLAFYLLLKAYREDPNKYLNTWEFLGEILVDGNWQLMSYKCPTRLTDIYQENPGLLERNFVTGKSGAKYYQYRIAPNPSMEKIVDETLRDFYKKIKSKL